MPKNTLVSFKQSSKSKTKIKQKYQLTIYFKKI